MSKSSGAGGIDPATTTSPTNAQEFPIYPGEEFYAHEAKDYLERAEIKFTQATLWASASGQKHPNTLLIEDEIIFPALPPGHRDYERRQERNAINAVKNKNNQVKRLLNELKAWNEIYSMVKGSVEPKDKTFADTIKQECDINLSNPGLSRGLRAVGIEPLGYFDGPRAWRLVLHKLANPTRRKEDKEFYTKALDIQKSAKLPNGTLGSVYPPFAAEAFRTTIPRSILLT